jgi:Flp pilus assembly protein TadG
MAATRHEDGASVVEFALISLVLFTIIFGGIQYGYHYWSLSTASASARELARELAVGNDAAACVRVASERAGMPATGAVTVTVQYLDASGTSLGTATYTNGVLGTAAVAPAVGSRVSVTVSYPSLGALPVPLPRDSSGVVRVTETASQIVNDDVPDPLACS